MKKIFGFVAIAAVLGFAGFSVQANAATGKALYQANCAACHGANATGGIGPNIVGRNAKDVTYALSNVPMMMSFKGSITKSNADNIGRYLSLLGSSKMRKKENNIAKNMIMKRSSAVILKTERAAITMGRKLFKDSSLGTNGKSCNSCHINMGRSYKKGPMGAMNFFSREKYPRYFMMAKRVMSLDQIINTCVKMALKGKPLKWNDPKLTALNAYISSLHK